MNLVRISFTFLLSALALTVTSETTRAEANDKPVIDKVEDAVERGAKATADGVEHAAQATRRGIEKGAQATERGVKRGVEATTNGVKRAAQATQETADHVADKIGRPAESADK
jgi:phage-related protein